MKKFSDFKSYKTRKIYEQELTLEKPEEKTEEPKSLEDPKPEETKPEVGEVTKSEPSKFFSKIFEARQMAHIYHLQVKGDMGSHAAHLALGAYYEGILEFIDELIETYHGQYELVESFDMINTIDTKSKPPIQYFEELVMFIKSTRNTYLSAEDTHLQNVIDEVYRLYKILNNG